MDMRRKGKRKTKDKWNGGMGRKRGQWTEGRQGEKFEWKGGGKVMKTKDELKERMIKKR